MQKASSTTNLIACVTIIGAVVAGMATGPAFAQQPGAGEFQFAFKYKPSELLSAPAAEKLLVRLEGEVRDFCTPEGRLTLDQHNEARACIAETMESTVSKFASATVAQAYDLRARG